MKKVFTVTGAIVMSAVILQACQTQTATQVQAEEENTMTSNQHVTAQDPNTSADALSNDVQTERDQSTTAWTVVYQDQNRTVYQMNQQQLSALSGYKVDNASIQNIVQSLQQETTWLNQQFSNEDAVLIANAAIHEGETIQHTLEKILQKRATDLRLVVYQSSYRQTAHFGTNNNNGNNQNANHVDEEASVAQSTDIEADQTNLGSPITVVYQDNYRTVYQMNQLQLATLTGKKIENASIQTVIQILQQENTWLAQQLTNADATLIANAALNEANSIQHTIEKMLRTQATDLQLVVYHSQYRSTAHFGTNNH